MHKKAFFFSRLRTVTVITKREKKIGRPETEWKQCLNLEDNPDDQMTKMQISTTGRQNKYHTLVIEAKSFLPKDFG